MLEQLTSLVDGSVRRHYSAGSTILYQGEVPRSACILLDGVARVFSISFQGDEQIVMFHTSGEFFPSSWIFNKSTSALFFYEAVTDCEVAFVPRQEFMEYMKAEPVRLQAMLEYFATNYSASLIRINALEQPRAREKLAYTLYYLCQRYGDRDKQDIHIPLALTHQSLASLVGLTRETTAIEMNKLKKQGIIVYQRQQYTINRDRLLELIGEDSFKDLQIS